MDAYKTWMLKLLPEIFGATESNYGYVLDNGWSGILGTIDKLSASDASKGARPGSETIASHLRHALYLMELFEPYLRGESPQTDWPGSWRDQVVDEPAWQNLCEEVRKVYAKNLELVEKTEEWNEDAVSASLILLTHTAYHLGEIRQIYSAFVQ